VHDAAERLPRDVDFSEGHRRWRKLSHACGLVANGKGRRSTRED
jgi:hypothetical protein